MFLNADLTIKQVEKPFNNWCCSGHNPPEMFKRDGEDGIEEPTRFFEVVSKDINGVFCEICLIIANYVNSQNKKNFK